jgi:hypothetical protein
MEDPENTPRTGVSRGPAQAGRGKGIMHKLRQTNDGFVLVSTLIILVSLTLIVVTVAWRNTLDEQMAANQRDAVNAMTIAESGIEAGFAKVRKDYVKARKFMTNELVRFSSSPMLNPALSGGSYAVTFPVVNSNYVVMRSVGRAAGAERVIEVVIEIDADGMSEYAILTELDIDSVSGEPIIEGPYANVHSNSNIDINGNPQIDGNVSASGTIEVGGDPVIGGEQTSGAAVIEIPHVYPPEYREFATVVLTADCRVQSPGGALLADLADGGQWHGWDCAVGDKWVMADGDPFDGLFDGFYYAHGNVIVSGSPERTWYTSFVAEGYIEISGNADFRPWASKAGNRTGDSVADEILFLAGNDLKINGNPTQQFNGIMAAHMDIQVSGNPFLEGSLLAENGKHAMGQEVTTGQQVKNLVDKNEFNGNMVLEASGTMMIGSGNPARIKAWRELVH